MATIKYIFDEGMAYAYADQIIVHNRWQSRKYGARIKRKTSILMDGDGNMQAFGKDARRKLCTKSYLITF